MFGVRPDSVTLKGDDPAVAVPQDEVGDVVAPQATPSAVTAEQVIVQVTVLPLIVTAVVVAAPGVPVATVGAVIACTVKDCVFVEPSLLAVSVRVRVALLEPQVRTAVAEVFEVTVIVPRLAPVPPLTVNNPVAD